MSLGTTLDTALDRLIVPGYGSRGFAVRRRLPERPSDPPRMDGSVVLVTDAASGIGLAARRRLVEPGARVPALGRNPARAAHCFSSASASPRGR